MKNNSGPAVLISVLNMGLGHATRSLPVIRHFQEKDWTVFLASSGRSLIFLRQELPGLTFLELPDYNLEYSPKGVSLSRLIVRLPALLRKISTENEMINNWVRERNISMIISDHRYGCYSPAVPSFFLSHQLTFIAPGCFRPMEFIGRWFNRQFHRKYSAVLVPDEKNDGMGLLTGRLSFFPEEGEYYFCGILSSVQKMNQVLRNPILFSVSGPEPQRSVFEQLLRSQLDKIPGKKVIALGKPESDQIERPDADTTIYHHLSRSEMGKVMNSSEFIVTRPGYSTIMELAELGKKALFIPTPGQTEQLYLARRMKDAGWFHYVSQKEMDLSRDIPVSKQYPGFPRKFETGTSLNRISELIQNYLNNQWNKNRKQGKI